MPRTRDEPVIKRSLYEKEDKRPALKISRALGTLLFIVFFLVILSGLAIFWIVRDDIDQNYFRELSIKLTWNLRGRAETSPDKIIFDGKSDNAYAPFKDGLAVLTTNRLVCYDAVGKEIVSAERHFKNPCLQTSSKTVLAYDRGGDTLVVATDRSIILDTKTERQIITAKMNKQGYIALVTQKERYKSLVTVLNATGSPVYEYYSPYYVIDAALSPDSSLLAVSCVGVEDSWANGIVKVFDLTKEEPLAEMDLGDDIGLEIFFPKKNKILAVCEKNISFFGTDGVLLNKRGFYDTVLLDYSVMNTGIAVRSAYAYTGIDSNLDLFDFDGNLVGSCELNEEIICQSGGGGYVTLVTSGSILVYDYNLTLKSSEPNASHARQILQRDDGTMFFIFNDYAQLYSP